VVIAAGPISQISIVSRFATRTQAILAAGSVQVSGAGKLDAQIAETTVQGNAGVSVSASGEELTLAIANSSLVATSGAISITSPGRQGTLDYSLGQMRAANGVTVNLSGPEGQIAMQNVTVNAGLGSASFITAVGGARPAKTVIFSSNITSGGSVTVQSSEAGQGGEAILDGSRVTATGSVVVRSGPQGTTNVKLNTLRSNSMVGAYVGPSGSCTAEGNTITSPARQLCLP
jgi:parallel beta-helix repeat protein